jgi:hypothetical protein
MTKQDYSTEMQEYHLEVAQSIADHYQGDISHEYAQKLVRAYERFVSGIGYDPLA